MRQSQKVWHRARQKRQLAGHERAARAGAAARGCGTERVLARTRIADVFSVRHDKHKLRQQAQCSPTRGAQRHEHAAAASVSSPD
eukprot:630821-Prymnesium_polylepis.1